MIIRIFFPIVLVISGLLILGGILHEAGIPIGGMFTDEAEKIRASAELERATIEMQRVKNDHEAFMFLIKKLAEPRASGTMIFLLVCMAGVILTLAIMLMREQTFRKFGEMPKLPKNPVSKFIQDRRDDRDFIAGKKPFPRIEKSAKEMEEEYGRY